MPSLTPIQFDLILFRGMRDNMTSRRGCSAPPAVLDATHEVIPRHDSQEVFSKLNSDRLAIGRCRSISRPCFGRIEGEVLYSFQGGAEAGSMPAGGVVFDKAGNLYGVTSDGRGLSARAVDFTFSRGWGINRLMRDFGSKQIQTQGDYMTKTAQHREWNSGIRRRLASAALTLAVVLGLGAISTHSAQAQANQPATYKETVLYSFTGGSGAVPLGVVMDGKGNLYGTTTFGGASNAGVVFKVSKSGKETVLYSFTGGADGGNPFGGVIFDAKGNLYGDTNLGGDLSGCNGRGCGVVFKLSPTGKENVLYNFTGGTDGGNPTGSLVFDAERNLYGNASNFGASANGVVFKVSSKGNETVLHSFTGGVDGANPSGGLIFDAKGNLYGTTRYSDNFNGGGVVFKLSSKGKETVLYDFTGRGDGGNPCDESLVFDAKGNLYGTTVNGGYSANGVVFKVSSKGNETVLYSFTGGADGANPYGGLIFDAKGNLYGTTSLGGNLSACTLGCGTVFKLNSKGKETAIYSFSGADGTDPVAGVVADAKGNLYGTTFVGGAKDQGVVFKLSPSRKETVLHSSR
jgi:uncharacterized repeat protein (TIGR03803 family)